MFGLKTISKVYNVLTHKAQPKTDDPGWTIYGSGINPSWGSGWWQQAFTDPKQAARISPGVEACIGHISRASAMLPIEHYQVLPEGGTRLIPNSPVYKVLRKPNKYQTRSDFILNLVRCMLYAGNGYAVAVRNPEFEITALHLLPPTGTRHYVDPTDQEIYYYVSGNQLSGMKDMLVPARDMLHLRTITSETDPLQGITAITSAAASVAAGNSINGNNAAFFNNMSRPSGVLTTELELDADQTKALRERWEQQSSLLNAGKTPVLSHGLGWSPLSMSASDAELVNFYKLSLEDVARVLGIPSALINIDTNSSTFSNVESLLNMWVTTSLGSMIDAIELSLEDLFQLPDNQRINFEMEYLLRGNLQNRMDAYGKGILSGVYSINEARNKEGLKPIEGGNEPRIQQQNVPLTYYEDDLELKKERLDLDKEVADNNAKAAESAANEPVAPEEEDPAAKYLSVVAQIKSVM